MFDTLLKEVKRLADYELTDSRVKFEPQFHSIHEGYGVLAEEIEAAKEEAKHTSEHFESVLRNIRFNRMENLRNSLVFLNEYALNAAAEFIQVAAMAQKMMEIIKEEKK